MKISFIIGIAVKYDACSNAVIQQMQWLLESNHQVKLFSYKCEHDTYPFINVTNEEEILADSFFVESDIVIFHFGIFYSLFNLIFTIPQNIKKIVFFHNITPMQYAADHDKPLIKKSIQQLTNINHADYVFCISNYNRELLNKYKIISKSTVLPLPYDKKLTCPRQKPSINDGIIRICFIGRFVVSKGIIDLLSAIKLILASKPKQKIKLDIISNIKFCSVDFLQKINNIINELKTDFPTLSDINLHYNINDSEKNLILSAADLFVLPTYHEGFCVPILEAFASGCIVVVYDIEGIKMTAGHLAIKVPLGNTNILTEILVEQLNIVSSSSWQKNYSEYCQNCLEHLKQFSTDKIKKLFLLSIT